MTVKLETLRYREFDRQTEEVVFDNPLEISGPDRTVRMSTDELQRQIDQLKQQGSDAAELEWGLLRATRISETA